MTLEDRLEKIELELAQGLYRTDDELVGRSARWFLKLGRLNWFGRWADTSMQAGRRRWLIAGINLLFGSLAFGRAGSAREAIQGGATNTVRATTFFLKDDAGRSRARLTATSPTGEPELSLFDEKGVRRVELGMWNGDWGRLRLYDEKNRCCAELIVSQGEFQLDLFDERSTPCASLRMQKGRPSLTLNDEKGQCWGHVDVLEDEPMLTLLHPCGQFRAPLDRTFNGPPRLNLYDSKGARSSRNLFELAWRAIWKGAPILTLSDGTRMRAMLTTLDDSMPPLSEGFAADFGTSGVTVYDDNGQLRATLGLSTDAINIGLSEEKDRVLATLCKLHREMQLILFGETGIEGLPSAIFHVAPTYLWLTLYDKKGADRTTLALTLSL